MPTARGYASCLFYQSNISPDLDKVILAGGDDGNQGQTNVDILDTKTWTW